jgi:hypothetical protein
MTTTTTSTVALRPASDSDERTLHELSELDSARRLERPAVLALVDETPVAAMSLSDGRVVADPFTRTEDVVELLRARVETLGRAA